VELVFAGISFVIAVISVGSRGIGLGRLPSVCPLREHLHSGRKVKVFGGLLT